jgi:hypothetical protein
METNNIAVRWTKLLEFFSDKFGKNPDVETILFLIGIQEIGKFSSKNKFEKEEKEDLMHVAMCTVLSQSGYYEIEKYDKDNWPHFKKLKELPKYNVLEQENFLKDHILLYFENIGALKKN